MAQQQSHTSSEPQQSHCISALQQPGLEIALLSGGQGGATEVRARQLGIRHCLVGIKDKPAALTALQAELGVTATGTAFVGAGTPQNGSVTRTSLKSFSTTTLALSLRQSQ